MHWTHSVLRAAHPNDLLRTEMSPSSFSHNANSVHNWRHFKLIYSKSVISLNQIQIRSYVNMYLNNISILKDSQTSSFYSKCINSTVSFPVHSNRREKMKCLFLCPVTLPTCAHKARVLQQPTEYSPQFHYNALNIAFVPACIRPV